MLRHAGTERVFFERNFRTIAQSLTAWNAKDTEKSRRRNLALLRFLRYSDTVFHCVR